jgi:transcriptional regulator with XRE-family HTH domain
MVLLRYNIYSEVMNMTTGERIRQLRIDHQMTQEELGAKVGVQKAAIYKYENGLVVNLKRSVIEKLALALDTTPTYLMGMEDNDVSDSLSSERTAILTMLRESEARDQARISEMIKDFQKLNEDGKEKAVERIHELTEIERFQNLHAIAFESYREKHKK